MRFPPDVRSPLQARRMLRAALEEAGLDELVDVAVLLSSELCDNAVLHAGTAFDVELVVTGRNGIPAEVMVAVTDQGPGPLELHLAMPRTGRAATHGRGLRLVEKLAAEWGTQHRGGHHRTWFILRPDRPPEPKPPAERPDSAGRRWPPPEAARALLYVPAGLAGRLDLPQLASELLRRLCEVLDAEGADVWVDHGDGHGAQRLAAHGGALPAAAVQVPLPLPLPLHGWLQVAPAAESSAATAAEVAELSAQRIALAVESESLRAAQQRRYSSMSYLAETSELLAQSLDVNLTVAMVPQLVVPRLGRWCAVHMIDESGGLRLAALTHADEDALPRLRAELEGAAQAHRLPEPGSGRTVQPASVITPKDGITVVLSARGEPLGTLTVGRFTHRPHTPEEIMLISDLARRASLAIDNAKITALHAQTSQALQQALLPRDLPVASGVEFAADYVPVSTGSDVGGDFYDASALDEARWLISIGDVCGKGPRAAARTGVVREVLRVLISDGRSVPRAIELLNDVMLEAHDPEQFCTLAAALINRPEPGQPPGLGVQLVLAGHDKPVLLRADGGVELVGEHGTAVGLVHDVSPVPTAHWLRPGDALIAYTDGVTERRRGAQQFGQQRLMDVLSAAAGKPAAKLVAAVREAVEAFSPEPLRDDMALLVVRAVP